MRVEHELGLVGQPMAVVHEGQQVELVVADLGRERTVIAEGDLARLRGLERQRHLRSRQIGRRAPRGL